MSYSGHSLRGEEIQSVYLTASADWAGEKEWEGEQEKGRRKITKSMVEEREIEEREGDLETEREREKQSEREAREWVETGWLW